MANLNRMDLGAERVSDSDGKALWWVTFVYAVSVTTIAPVQ
jgi:hypothetical protein